MTAVLDAIITTLAVSRLTRLIVDDDIAQPLRDLVAAIDPDRENVGYLVTCNACSSIWLAAVTLLIVPRKLQAVLALSEATVLLREKFT